MSIHHASRNEDIIPAIEAARAAEAQALNVFQSPLIFVNHTRIIEHVAKVRLPAIYGVPEWVDEGELVAYGPRVATVLRQIMVPQLIKLLRGAKPADARRSRPLGRGGIALSARAATPLTLHRQTRGLRPGGCRCIARARARRKRAQMKEVPTEAASPVP
jgi:putative ABC transport system substrate-binding protein